MVDLFDTTAVQDDANHWDDLAARITAASIGRRSDSVLVWLAGPRATAAAISLVVAVVALLLAREPEAPRRVTAREQWTPVLAPADAVGRSLVTGDGPPAVGRLISERRGFR